MSTIRRALLLGFLMMLFVAAPAAAQYAGTGDAVLSDSTPAAGQAVTVSGEGFAGGERVVARLEGNVMGTTTASGAGVASFTFTAPSACGTYSVTMTGDSGRVVAGSIEVPCTGGTTSALPRTGGDTLPLAQAGFVMVGGGALLVLVARRRSRARSAA